MTLTQLNAFVLVARLGSVTAAASALGVSEPAVSQALSALRQHLGDQLVTRGPAGMTMTAGGSRLIGLLQADRQFSIRPEKGAPQQLDPANIKSIIFGQRADPNQENEALVALGDMQSDQILASPNPR